MHFVNKVIIAGNLGHDPLVGATASGMLVAKFSVAVDTPQRDGAVKTIWFQCLATGWQAEFVQNHLRRGDAVSVEGSLDPYEFKPLGSNRSVASFRVVARKIRELNSPKPSAEFPLLRETAAYHPN